MPLTIYGQAPRSSKDLPPKCFHILLSSEPLRTRSELWIGEFGFSQHELPILHRVALYSKHLLPLHPSVSVVGTLQLWVDKLFAWLQMAAQMALSPEWAFHPWFRDPWPVVASPGPVPAATWTDGSKDRPAVLTADQALLSFCSERNWVPGLEAVSW